MCCDLCRGGELDCLGPNAYCQRPRAPPVKISPTSSPRNPNSQGYSTSVSESWYRVDCCLAASCKFCGRGDAPTTAPFRASIVQEAESVSESRFVTTNLQTGQYNLPLQRRGMVGVENF